MNYSKEMRDAMRFTRSWDRSPAEQRHAAHVDNVGHSSVQPWSAGPLFPCVIATVERYPEHRRYRVMVEYKMASHACVIWTASEERAVAAVIALHEHPETIVRAYVYGQDLPAPSVSYELIAYGRREEYATREDAEQVARWLNDSTAARARWVAGQWHREVQS